MENSDIVILDNGERIYEQTLDMKHVTVYKNTAEPNHVNIIRQCERTGTISFVTLHKKAILELAELLKGMKL